MSADNYYIIRKDKKTGQFVPVMGSGSDDGTPEIRKNNLRYDTVKEAAEYAWGQNPEYGVTIHDECDIKTIIATDNATKVARILMKHYLPAEDSTVCLCGEPMAGDIRDSIARHQSELVAEELGR